MTDLGDLLAELAQSPAPPRALDADRAFSEGRRRHRRRRLAAAGAAVLTAVVLAGVGVVAASMPRPGTDVADPGPSATPNDPRAGASVPASILQWAGARDARHLYLAYPTCATSPCPKDTYDVVGSDDGGRTWTTRAVGFAGYPSAVLDSGALLAVGAGGQAGLLLSTDGGRDWSPLTPRTTPVEAVPAGGSAVCRYSAPDLRCVLHAVDPVAGTVAPLAAQPADIEPQEPVLDRAGQLWVSGVDQVTGRPAVAGSADRGRTWTRHPFTDLPVCTESGCLTPQLASADGGTVFAVAVAATSRTLTVHRGSAGGDWRPVDSTAIGAVDAAWSFVAADGTQIVCAIGSRADGGCQFWALSGDSYQPVTLPGLPDRIWAVRRASDGWYYTISPGEHAVLYGSVDGRHWSPVTR